MATSEEQKHYRKFYEGTFLIKGWKARIEEILKHIDPADQAATHERLERLGERIGREWAKDNAVRRINTTMLQKWGERLKSSKRNGPANMIAEIGDIETEVDTLLA